MATDNELEELFRRVAQAGTAVTATQQSQSNLPDVRNLPSTAGARVVNQLEAARNVDLEAVRRPGITLDTQTGAPAGTRFQLAFVDDTPAAVKQLQVKYGAQNIALSPQGKIVIRNLLNEETGEIRDVLLDETQMSAKDLLDISAAIPEVVGAMAGMRGAQAIPKIGKAAGKTGFARDVIAGAVGAQAAAELSQRALTDATSTLTETLEKRGRGALADAAFSVVTAGAAKVIPSIKSRLSGPLSGHQTIVQTEALDAIDRIERITGTRIPLSIGEETGHPLVMKGEALLEKVPGGTATIRRQKEAQEVALRDVQLYMLGQAPLPTEASVGIKAIDTLKRVSGSVDEQTAQASKIAADTASAEILSTFDSAALPTRQMFKRPVGQAIRTKAQAELASFKGKSRTLYEDVYSSPGGQDAIIPTAPLRNAAKEIRSNLPTRAKTVETLDYDTYGGPIVRTTKGREVLRDFVSPQLRKFLDSVADGLDPKMPLNEIVQMRQIVNDAIDQADVLPGINPRFLKQFSHSLTEAIDKGVNSLDDKTLATKLRAANDYYKTNRPRFERRGIIELFRDPENPGYIGDAEIVRRISAGEVSADRYFDMREFLGAGSNEFKTLKRAVLDDIYETSRITGQGNLIDAKAFVDQIRGLDREVVQDLLGTQGDKMVSTARILGQIQGKIDSADLDRLLSTGSPSADAFRELVAAQQAKDAHYANTIIKRFVKGEAGTESIKPDEFVSRFLDTAKSPGEVQEVMALLQGTPDLVESIQRKTLERFFATAARSPDPIDITKNVVGDPTQALGGRTLLKALGDEQQQEKLRAVLGSDTMALLQDFVRVESAREVKENTAKTVGGLVGGGIMSRLIRLDLKDAVDIAKYRFAAYVLANPSLRSYLTRQIPAADTTALGRAVIASGPFLQAAAEEFGDESGLLAFLDNLNTAFERAAGTAQGEQPAAGEDQALLQMFQQAAPAGAPAR